MNARGILGFSLIWIMAKVYTVWRTE